jgi:hypothetical protein
MGVRGGFHISGLEQQGKECAYWIILYKKHADDICIPVSSLWDSFVKSVSLTKIYILYIMLHTDIAKYLCIFD